MLRRARQDVAAVGRRERRVLPPRLARIDPAGHAVRIHRYWRALRWLLQWPAGMASAGWLSVLRCRGGRRTGAKVNDFRPQGLFCYEKEQNAPAPVLELWSF